MTAEPFHFEPLTRDQQILCIAKELAGPYPGPNQATIAVLLAIRLVEIQEGTQP